MRHKQMYIVIGGDPWCLYILIFGGCCNTCEVSLHGNQRALFLSCCGSLTAVMEADMLDVSMSGSNPVV